MKADELMVGDWVQGFLPDTYSQVCGILNEWQVAIIGRCAYMEVSIDDICPILLTPEILEKNFPDPTDGLTWFPEEGGFNCHTYVPDCEINAFGLFKYVHELQHALRLCGIDKGIVI